MFRTRRVLMRHAADRSRPADRGGCRRRGRPLAEPERLRRGLGAHGGGHHLPYRHGAPAGPARHPCGASTGDYLYWVFPSDAGQRATVKAKVTLPENTARHGDSTWQVDVYDGLRRRQACMYGKQTGKVAADAATVELTCVLRTVRAWSEPWANDPLPGSYYVRLTVVDLPSADLGLPVQTEVRVTAADKGGAADVDGSLSKPLVPGVSTVEQAADGASAAPVAVVERTGGRLVLRLVDRPLAVDGRRRSAGRVRGRLRLLADARQRPPVQGPAGRLTAHCRAGKLTGLPDAWPDATEWQPPSPRRSWPSQDRPAPRYGRPTPCGSSSRTIPGWPCSPSSPSARCSEWSGSAR